MSMILKTEEVIGFVKGWAKNKNKKGFGNVDLNDMGLTILFEAGRISRDGETQETRKRRRIFKKKRNR